jgi:HAMP domain-containing protein
MTFAKIRSVQDHLAQAGGKPLGSLLWWSLNGNRIDHPRLEELARRHGLDAKYVPAELKPVQAFRRACRHASTKLPAGLLLRPIAETTDAVLVGLVRERVNEANQDLDYDLVTRVNFNKANHAILCDVENGVTAEIERLYEHHLEHTTEDIRGMLTAFLGEAGVSLRESGGVYFVPASFQPTLDALCTVVEAVGQNQTFTLPIVETAETKGVLREVAKRSLDDEIRQLHEAMQRFEGDNVRQSTLERKLDGFEELRGRVNLFARVLSFKADALNGKISAIQSGLRQQLAGGLQAVQARPVDAGGSPPAPLLRQVAVGGVGF